MSSTIDEVQGFLKEYRNKTSEARQIGQSIRNSERAEAIEVEAQRATRKKLCEEAERLQPDIASLRKRLLKHNIKPDDEN